MKDQTLREKIENILDRYFAKREYYAFQGIRDEVLELIKKERENAVKEYIKYDFTRCYENGEFSTKAVESDIDEQYLDFLSTQEKESND